MKTLLVWLALLALIVSVGCGSTSQDADALSSDVALEDSNSPTDIGDLAQNPGVFACGTGLTCQPDQACRGQWPGVCGGPTPGPSGCGPNCKSTQCGGGTFCLCQSFSCTPLPSGCSDCTCAVAALQGWEVDACTCTRDSSGSIHFECMGA